MNRILAATIGAVLAVTLTPVRADAVPPRQVEFSGVVKGTGHGKCSLTKRIGVRWAILRCPDGFKRPTLRACPTEDSRACYWHAATRGNGKGRSFVDLAGRTYPVRIVSEGAVA